MSINLTTHDSSLHDSKIHLFSAEEEDLMAEKSASYSLQNDIQNNPSSSSIEPLSSSLSHDLKRKRLSEDHTPRPPNSFMIYRKEKHAEIKSQYHSCRSLNNNIISKVIANMWKQEPLDVKEKYIQMADDAKKEHLLKYPDYKYKPKKNPKKSFAADIIHPFELLPSNSASIKPYISTLQPIQPHTTTNQHHLYYSQSTTDTPDLLSSTFFFDVKDDYFDSLLNDSIGKDGNPLWMDSLRP